MLAACGRSELNDLPDAGKADCSCTAPPAEFGKPCGPGIGKCSEEPDCFAPHGYSCFPSPPVAAKGHCYLGCDATAPNKDAYKNGVGLPHVDSRCNGWPDYYCLGFSSSPSQHRFCLRFYCTPGLVPDGCGIPGCPGSTPIKGPVCQGTASDPNSNFCGWSD